MSSRLPRISSCQFATILPASVILNGIGPLQAGLLLQHSLMRSAFSDELLASCPLHLHTPSRRSLNGLERMVETLVLESDGHSQQVEMFAADLYGINFRYARYHRFSRMPVKYSPEWLAALPPQFTTPRRHTPICASEPPVSRESLPLKSASPPVPNGTPAPAKITENAPCDHPLSHLQNMELPAQQQIAPSVLKATVHPIPKKATPGATPLAHVGKPGGVGRRYPGDVAKARPADTNTDAALRFHPRQALKSVLI
jgi:hypothetical protein